MEAEHAAERRQVTFPAISIYHFVKAEDTKTVNLTAHVLNK